MQSYLKRYYKLVGSWLHNNSPEQFMQLVTDYCALISQVSCSLARWLFCTRTVAATGSRDLKFKTPTCSGAQLYKRELQLLFTQARANFQQMLRVKLSGSSASLSSIGSKSGALPRLGAPQTPGASRGSREERATPFELHLANLLQRVEQLVCDEQEFLEKFFNLTFSNSSSDEADAGSSNGRATPDSERGASAAATAARHRQSVALSAQTRLTADQQEKLVHSVFQELEAQLVEYVLFCDKAEPLSSMPLLVLLEEHLSRARKRSPQLFPLTLAFKKTLDLSRQAFDKLLQRLLKEMGGYTLVKKLSTKKMSAAVSSGAASNVLNSSILISYFAGNALHDPNSSSILPTVRLFDEFATLAHRIFRDSGCVNDFESAIQKLLAVHCCLQDSHHSTLYTLHSTARTVTRSASVNIVFLLFFYS